MDNVDGNSVYESKMHGYKYDHDFSLFDEKSLLQISEGDKKKVISLWLKEISP